MSQTDQFFESSTFNSRELADVLGDAYREALQPFFEFPSTNEGYSRKYKTTKPYVLNERTVEKLTEIWRNGLATRVVNRANDADLTAGDLPSNGVLRPKKAGIEVPSLIPMSLDHINQLIEADESLGDARGRSVALHVRRRFVRRLRTLYLVRQYVRLLGGVPNLYADTEKPDWRTDGNGRLYGLGDFHIQRCPRDLRPLLLRGTGWIDADFKACHPSVFVALATAYGIAVPTWQDYLANRKVRVEELAEAIEVRPSKIKRVLLALLYGQPLSASSKGQLMDVVGKEGVDRLKSNAFYTALRKELRRARPVIIEQHRKGYQITNAVGKQKAIRKESVKQKTEIKTRKPKRKRVHPRKLLSHIITGYEAWVLRAAVDYTPDTKVLIHDGFITANKPDLTELEKHLNTTSQDKWGFPLNQRLETSKPF
jgi:DNA-binding winged helix-turn-helix (wHTH) protein